MHDNMPLISVRAISTPQGRTFVPMAQFPLCWLLLTISCSLQPNYFLAILSSVNDVARRTYDLEILRTAMIKVANERTASYTSQCHLYA